MDRDNIIFTGYIIYVLVASVIFYLYMKKVLLECMDYEPSSKEKSKKFYRKQLFKGFFAIFLLFAITLTIVYIFKPGEAADRLGGMAIISEIVL